MSGGILGVAGDLASVVFLCFICSLAIQLYCVFSRRSTTRPPTPLPSIQIPSPPPQQPAAACKQLYLLRFQRSASCPVVSAIAPPLSRPNKLSSAYNVNPRACSLASDTSPLGCTVASEAHTADLAKLMQVESGEEDEVEAENFITSVPPPRLLFTIKEEGKDEDAMEQANVASATCAHTPGATCAHAIGAGLVSQVSSASSEGGVSLWSTASSPALSYLSASSSPFPITSSPPRSSFWAHPPSSLLLPLPYTKASFSHATN